MASESRPSEGIRAVIAVGVLAVGLIHTLDLQSKFHETPYLGVAYVALIVASVVAAGGVLMGSDQRWMSAAALVALTPMVGYVLSRSIGLPDANGDIGNWLEPLGVASLFVESAVLVLVGELRVNGKRMGRDSAALRGSFV